MRDNPYHNAAILAGMWGGDNSRAAIYRPLIRQLLRPSWVTVRIRLRLLILFSTKRVRDEIKNMLFEPQPRSVLLSRNG